MSGSEDFIPFANNPGTPKGYQRGNWKHKGSFQNNMTPYNRRYNNFNNSNRNFHGQRQHTNSNDSDISIYYHPSMMHDPWRDLLRKLNDNKCEDSPVLHVGLNKEESSSKTTLSTSDTSSQPLDHVV